MAHDPWQRLALVGRKEWRAAKPFPCTGKDSIYFGGWSVWIRGVLSRIAPLAVLAQKLLSNFAFYVWSSCSSFGVVTRDLVFLRMRLLLITMKDPFFLMVMLLFNLIILWKCVLWYLLGFSPNSYSYSEFFSCLKNSQKDILLDLILDYWRGVTVAGFFNLVSAQYLNMRIYVRKKMRTYSKNMALCPFRTNQDQTELKCAPGTTGAFQRVRKCRE